MIGIMYINSYCLSMLIMLSKFVWYAKNVRHVGMLGHKAWKGNAI